MSYVLTLVTPTHDADLLNEATSRVLSQPYMQGASVRTLEADRASDIVFTAPSDTLASLRSQCAGTLSGLKLDWALQDEAGRAKSLLLADMDSTMITVECIDELADFAGLKAEISAVTEAAMQGKLEFLEALTARVALLKGLSTTALETCYTDRVRPTAGAASLLTAAKGAGMRAVLVSGGFTFFTQRIASLLGFDRHVANELEVAAGALTGRVVPPLSGPNTKVAVLKEEAAAAGIPLSAVVAVGDGANDIPMLQTAGFGVAFKAKPAAAAADARIEYGDLTTLAYFLGLKP